MELLGEPQARVHVHPLATLRVYSTVALCTLMALNCAAVVAQTTGMPRFAIAVVASAATVWLTAFWLRRPPRFLVVVAGGTGYTLWALGAAADDRLGGVIIAGALALLVSRLAARRLLAAVALAALLAPAAIRAATVGDVTPLLGGAWAAGSFLGFLLVFAVNRYIWGLTEHLDAAQRQATPPESTELAIAQDRAGIAADLHDIQAQTIAAARRKLRTAAQLTGSDPTAARLALLDADALVMDTLANVQEIAAGGLRLSFPAELADARARLADAGIAVTSSGDPADWDNPRAALVVREVTTNVLRHSQATAVDFVFSPAAMQITNDGAPADVGPYGGLDRLRRRLWESGILLETSAGDGTFVTRALRR
ncbi:MAG: histidine kinase dimerization and phosphoacceptor region [Schumannella sp.]|nr:histidine kinase dimerization and phosphoacceptor region [Schumannella sp.]